VCLLLPINIACSWWRNRLNINEFYVARVFNYQANTGDMPRIWAVNEHTNIFDNPRDYSGRFKAEAQRKSCYIDVGLLRVNTLSSKQPSVWLLPLGRSSTPYCNMKLEYVVVFVAMMVACASAQNDLMSMMLLSNMLGGGGRPSLSPGGSQVLSQLNPGASAGAGSGASNMMGFGALTGHLGGTFFSQYRLFWNYIITAD